MKRNALAPLAAVVAVAAVAVTATLLTGGNGSGSRPKALHLLGAAAGAADVARAAGITADYRVVGTLPTDTPPDGRVWSLGGAAPADVVTRLAAALHAGTPVRTGDTWHAGGLMVTRGQWTWSTCAVDVATGPGDTVTGAGCAVATSPSAVGSGGSSSSGTVVATPAPALSPTTGQPLPPVPVATPPDVATSPMPTLIPPPALPTSTVRDAARPVFAALALDLSSATLDTSPYGGSASLDPEVGGLRTAGLTTTVAVDGKGELQYAGGYLGTAVRGASYPLISAKQAFDALPALVHPELCQVAPDGKGCVTPPPAEITGAHLGLSLQQLQAGDPLLVPSWLYDVKGSPTPLAAVAVAPRYLAPETTAPPTGTFASDGPGSSGSGSAGPGSIEPNPVDPSTAPAPMKPVQLLSARAQGSDLVVTYASTGCGAGDVTPEVKEDSTQVVVFVRASASGAPGMACPAIAKPVDVTVKLQSPLGTRTVIDGSTNQPLKPS